MEVAMSLRRASSLVLVVALLSAAAAPALAAPSNGAGPGSGAPGKPGGGICADIENSLLAAEAEADKRSGTKAAEKWSRAADGFWRDGEVVGCSWAA
ncbi:MAG: hypothetical protein BGO81_12385 [Devosia sp. 66-22]|nr:MAG: hypothetical protein BGO81_12385 [Devosia sp. 66-22]